MILTVACKIWIRTIIVNAVIMTFAVPSGIIIGGLFGTLAAAAIGLFLTFPLLLLVIPLVKLSVKLPYSASAKIFWLWFYLELLIVLFYIFFFYLFNMLHNFRDKAFYLMATATSVALLLAMLWTKRSLKTIIADQL